MCYCVFYVAMCVAVCFRWQCELLGLSGGNVPYWNFWVAMCVVVCFRWQRVVLYVLNGNVCCLIFKVA